MCTYNYIDSTPQRPVWTTGTLSRGAWQDSAVFGLPHATYFNAVMMHHLMLVGNTEGSTIYFEHEKGTDEALATGVNAITSNIESGDFDITHKDLTRSTNRCCNFQGDGEFIMKIRRFIPDFLSQTGIHK